MELPLVTQRRVVMAGAEMPPGSLCPSRTTPSHLLRPRSWGAGYKEGPDELYNHLAPFSYLAVSSEQLGTFLLFFFFKQEVKVSDL